MGEYLRRTHAAHAPRTAGLRGTGRLLPAHKNAAKENKPWVQDLCKHPSVLPYLAPPKVKRHKRKL